MILNALKEQANARKAAEMAAYHKAERPYLGVANPVIHKLARDTRKGLDASELAELAQGLWDSNIHEARVAAASLLTLKRFRPDDAAVWSVLTSWPADFDAWAIADHACGAIALRVVADPTRLDTLESWGDHPNLWVRRAALVASLPWARLKTPDSVEAAERERILEWAAKLTQDQAWFAQKAVAWWLRELSRRDPARVQRFVEAHATNMKAFARKEATRLIP